MSCGCVIFKPVQSAPETSYVWRLCTPKDWTKEKKEEEQNKKVAIDPWARSSLLTKLLQGTNQPDQSTND